MTGALVRVVLPEVNVRTIRVVVVVAFALLIASCSRKPLAKVAGKPSVPANETALAPCPSVVGKWLTPTGGSIEFKADGTATMAGPNGAAELRYRLPDEHTIEMSRPDRKATVRWEILSLGAQELIIRDPDGKEVRLRRSE